MKYYTTGTFAKKANVSLRTIRYYDKVGLLKPSFIMENGYRQYSDQDFLKLQKILALKQLGFSLSEIFPLLLVNNIDSACASFDLQIDLVLKRIYHLENMKEALIQIRSQAKEESFEWSKLIELIHLSNTKEVMVEEFMQMRHLQARILLHDTYSTNQEKWYDWIYKHLKMDKVNKLLEVGCGNGELWINRKINKRNKEFYLSDYSELMLEKARNNLGREFSYLKLDCENLGFKDESFDSVICNHVLFYLEDMKKGIQEIRRVLRKKGVFYCTTYGKDHMREITQLVKKFDSKVNLSTQNYNEKFGLENGEAVLSSYFSSVQTYVYSDTLQITNANLLLDYIVSSFGNQNELLGSRLEELRLYIQSEIDKRGCYQVRKQAVLFICE